MVIQALHTVFTHLRYVVLSLSFSLVVAVTTLLWANLALVSYTWTNEFASWSFALNVTWSLILGSGTSMGWGVVTLIGITALLFGILVSMLHYAWRHARLAGSWRQVSTSTSGGALAALLGIGCAACGPLLLGSILALFGASGILVLLPFHGAELSVLAIGLLLYALYAVARVITAPNVCSI